MGIRQLLIAFSIASVSLVGCGGSTDSEVDDDVDLPADFDSVTEGLTVDPADEASEDHDQDDREHHGKPRHGRRLHNLFKRLDRADGTKDGTIVIASLPERFPKGLIMKLQRIDGNGDGIVTKDEVRATWRAGR
jgi:hypothetical protein